MPTAATVLSSGVLDPSHLFQHFGYAAILVVVLLGNAGVPAPEESVLVFGGYLAWQGRLELPLGHSRGHHQREPRRQSRLLGGAALRPARHRASPLPQARLAQAQSLITRYGARAVFASRFVAGFRTVAGPLAGAGGLPPLRFFIANLLGAVCYVPLPVLAGYGAGYGLGHWIEKLRGKLGLKEDLALFAVIVVVAGLVFLVKRWSRTRRASSPASSAPGHR